MGTEQTNSYHIRAGAHILFQSEIMQILSYILHVELYIKACILSMSALVLRLLVNVSVFDQLAIQKLPVVRGWTCFYLSRLQSRLTCRLVSCDFSTVKHHRTEYPGNY